MWYKSYRQNLNRFKKLLIKYNSSFNLNLVPRKPGIYIISFPDNCFYIGSSNNIKRRFLEHILTAEDQCHHNTNFQSKYNKFHIDGIKMTWDITLELKLQEQAQLDENYGMPGCLNRSPRAIRPCQRKRHRKDSRWVT